MAEVDTIMIELPRELSPPPPPVYHTATPAFSWREGTEAAAPPQVGSG